MLTDNLTMQYKNKAVDNGRQFLTSDSE